MDKYEYKVRADEIKSLIAEGEYAEAVKIADTIDWRRVRSVMMLCTISDLYKINRRYQESNDILLLAYEKHPTGRLIVYSLCELAIKMEEYARAVEYFKEFVQIAPRDTGKYILQYRLYEAQEVRLEERIAVLEEFKKRDYREKWAYELAYLYHRIGLATKCVEECDEMYLWFGEGKYVFKALELKALHAPLSSEQQAKYNAWIGGRGIEEEANEEDTQTDEGSPDAVEDAEDDNNGNDDIMTLPTTELPEVKPVDVGQYNTLNLQKVLAEGMKEVMTEEEPAEEPSIVEQIIAPLLQETGEISGAELEQYRDEAQEAGGSDYSEQEAVNQGYNEQEIIEPDYAVQEIGSPDYAAQEISNPGYVEQETVKPEIPRQQPVRESNSQSIRYDDVLSQEYDGQISLVVPDVKKVEKQITGQLSIEDVMAEWERMKKSNEQKRMEEVRQRILSHTGGLFADFDEATKSGLLEQLEKVFDMAAVLGKDSEPEIKKVIHPQEAESELREATQPKARSAAPQEESEPEKNEAVSELPEADEAPETTQEMQEAAAAEDDEVEELVEIEEADENIEASGDIEAVEGTKESGNIAAAKGAKESKNIASAKETKETKDVKAADTAESKKAADEKAQRSHENVRKARELTAEEKELFGPCVNNRKTREQLSHTLDNMSMAAYTGNVILTGEEGSALEMAKNLIREMQTNDSNFSGKAAKISGAVLNKKDIHETIGRLVNGALIIEKASGLNAETIAKLNKELEKYNVGLLLLMEDTKRDMNKLLAKNAVLNKNFNLRVDIEPLDDEALVAYAKRYAQEMEYSIDEFGILALHTRIAEMQTSDHAVSISEVKELVDEAIYYATRKTPKHFLDILLAKRYDDEDMIVIRENDFMHN